MLHDGYYMNILTEKLEYGKLLVAKNVNRFIQGEMCGYSLNPSFKHCQNKADYFITMTLDLI